MLSYHKAYTIICANNNVTLKCVLKYYALMWVLRGLPPPHAFYKVKTKKCVLQCMHSI